VRFEISTDKAGKARWALLSENGQSVASSGQPFSTVSNARRAARSFGERATSTEFEVYADAGGAYRWRAKSGNGQTTASSGESFSSRSNAQRAADNVRDNAGAATGP